MSKLWNTGNLNGQSAWTEHFTVGNDYVLDMQLVPYDVKASKVHAAGLRRIGVLTETERAAIDGCLSQLLEDYEQGNFTITPQQEDCHTAIEDYLTARLGDVGKKIHTGRSRNDQVLTAIRLYEIEQINEVLESTTSITNQFINLARKHEFIAMPGYTHSQPAMLSSVGMWAGSFAEMLLSSMDLLRSIGNMIDRSPLGTAAGFGVNVPLDREWTSQAMRFDRPMTVAMTAQHSRGRWEATIVHGLSSITEILAQFANDLILFSSIDYGFFTVIDELTTGSSIMPQKKNLDVAEIIRARHAEIVGQQFTLTQLTSNLRSGYHRDLQLSKGATITSFQTTLDLLEATSKLIGGIRVHEDKLMEKIHPEMFAADMANEIAMSGVPFREAYQLVKSRLETLTREDVAKKVRERTHLGSTGNLGLQILEKALKQYQK